MLAFIFVLFVAYFLGKLAVKKGLPRNMYWILVPIIWYSMQLGALFLGDYLQRLELEISFSFVIFLLSMLIPIIIYLVMYINLKKLPNKGEMESKIDNLGKEEG